MVYAGSFFCWFVFLLISLLQICCMHILQVEVQAMAILRMYWPYGALLYAEGFLLEQLKRREWFRLYKDLTRA